jgi:hypothetical protein
LHKWSDIKKLSNIELLRFFLDYAFIINRKEAEIHMMTSGGHQLYQRVVPADVVRDFRKTGPD